MVNSININYIILYAIKHKIIMPFETYCSMTTLYSEFPANFIKRLLHFLICPYFGLFSGYF